MSPRPVAWLLYSPVRLISVVVAAVLVLAAIAVLGLRDSTPASTGHNTQASTPEGPPRSTGVAISSGHSDDEGKAIGRAARRTVARFLDSYLAPTSRRELDRLRPMATPDLWNGLKIADPRNMPRGPMQKMEKEADGAFTANFVVTLPRDQLAIAVVAGPDGLLISSVEPVTP
jgi:hypothetical protein